MLNFLFARLLRVFLLALFFVLMLCPIKKGLAQDVPPAVANPQSIGAGAYLIPLDKAKQSVSVTDLPSGLSFNALNLAAYGLVYRLLENNVPVKWVIKAGKPKDGTDFSANVAQIYPSVQAASAANFISSAFVIDIAEINAQVCNSVNTPNLPDIDAIISNFGNNVSVYNLAATTTMDVRYTLHFAPQIAVLNNGGNTAAFTGIFTAAQIPYSEISTADLQTAADCYTYIVQPHANAAATITPAYISGVNSFMNKGGNFWAQGSMAIGLENQANIMTTNGIAAISNIINPPYNYVASGMPVMQFESSFPSGVSGVLGTFGLAPGSSWKLFTYPCLIINLAVGGNQIITYAADVNGAQAGGNLYYCGGNEFSLTAIPSLPATAGEVIQAQRMLLNTAFIPAGINYACAGNDICICRGNSVVLGCTEGGIGIGEVQWTPAIGLSCTDCPNPVANPNITTTYTVTPVVGLCNVSSTVTVTVIQEKPEVSNIDIDCNLDKTAYTVSFTISGGDAATYAVVGNTGTINGNLFTSDPITTSTPYTFTVADSYHCDTTITGTFNCILCQPAAILSGGGSACLEGNITSVPLGINLVGQSPWEIVYEIDGVIQTPLSATASNYVLDATQSGQYTLVSVEDANCFGSVVGTASVSAIPVPTVNLGSDTTLCLGKVITLDAGLPETALSWQDGSTNTTYATAVSGTYWVQLINECGIAADTVVVTFEDCSAPRCRPLLPDAISPNGDGVNDRLNVVFNCEVSFYHLLIFDRWGQKVFDSTDPFDGWTAMNNNQVLPLGLYVWKLEYQFTEDADDPHRIAKGNVLLLR